MINVNGAIYAPIDGSVPTDKIILDEAAVRALYGMAIEAGVGEAGKIKWSDIFIANTIPVHDCVVIGPYGDMSITARIVINSKATNALEEAIRSDDGSHVYQIGVILVFFFDQGYYDDILVANIGVVRGANMAKLKCRWMFAETDAEDDKIDLCYAVYGVWYTIMLSLLHPTTKMQIARSASQERIKQVVGTGKHKRGIIRYVRRINITEDDLSITDDTDGEKRKYNVLCWYVSGHWRHYKDGKVVFIKPYWKGELRETKKADETRLREIVTEGVQLC